MTVYKRIFYERKYIRVRVREIPLKDSVQTQRRVLGRCFDWEGRLI